MQFKYTATCREYRLDTETPVSIYLKLREQFDQCILLETTESKQLSYICCEPIAGVSVEGLNVAKRFNGRRTEDEACKENRDVLPIVTAFLQSFTIHGLSDDFKGIGMFGYIGYDAVRYFEDIDIPEGGNGIPDIQLDLYRYVVVFEHAKSLVKVISLYAEGEVQDDTLDKTMFSQQLMQEYPFSTVSPETSNSTDVAFIEHVIKGQRHCQRGDVFQVVLSRAFETKFSGDDFNVYRALRSINPSPYLFYFDYNEFHFFGSSPEAQLKIRKEKATINPIAGTYRTTGNEHEDRILADWLREDEKENAEHVMLVDLARNDLNKHYQDVSVVEYRKIEQYSHVMHMVSEVEGRDPVAKVHPLEILAHSFPAGTLSGAPKHRAMQIIQETELSSRGYYGGCVGFIGFDGSMNMAIMIRTFLSKGNTLHYQAGAGITAASVPEVELQEVENKVDALRLAIEQANSKSSKEIPNNKFQIPGENPKPQIPNSKVRGKFQIIRRNSK